MSSRSLAGRFWGSQLASEHTKLLLLTALYATCPCAAVCGASLHRARLLPGGVRFSFASSGCASSIVRVVRLSPSQALESCLPCLSRLPFVRAVPSPLTCALCVDCACTQGLMLFLSEQYVLPTVRNSLPHIDNRESPSSSSLPDRPGPVPPRVHPVLLRCHSRDCFAACLCPTLPVCLLACPHCACVLDAALFAASLTKNSGCDADRAAWCVVAVVQASGAAWPSAC